jgi:8-oxo-dGTP diphosphatase
MKAKHHGCTMLFLNPRDEVLMILRDNNPEIPYPNTLDLPGGHMEEGEEPADCVRREMQEELPGLDVGAFREFTVIEFPDRIDHLFWTRIDLEADVLNQMLREGQQMTWMSAEGIRRTEIAFDFKSVIEDFLGRAKKGLLD